MVVDKFGRHQSAVSVRRETKRQLRDTVGFKITNDGHIDVENKKIRNLNEPDAAKDAVSLTYMQTHCLLLDDERKSVDVKGCRLKNVDTPVDVKDVVNKYYVDDNCIQHSSQERGEVIDARDRWVINVRSPEQATDAVNKNYVDSNVIKKVSNSYLFGQSWLSGVSSPIFADDAVNVKYMLQNTVSLGEDGVFKAAEKRITDVADGFAESDAVNLQQLNDVRRYVKSEMYKVVKTFQYQLDYYLLKLSKPRSSEDEWTLDTKEIKRLIDEYDKNTEEKDWRSVYDVQQR